MKPKHQRALFITVCMCIIAAAVAVILTRFQDNLVFFVTPTDLKARMESHQLQDGQTLRLGGLVQPGSITQIAPGEIGFTMTDLTNHFTVHYKGIIPALFRDGQGAVAEGSLQPDGTFVASSLLAKHDEKYMPPEVADALKKSGHWEHDGSYTPPKAEPTP